MAALILVGCSSGGDKPSDGKADCTPTGVFERTGLPATFAVPMADVAARPSELPPPASGGFWVYVSPQAGAWLSDVDPISTDPSGVTVPLNDIARGQSNLGADQAPGAPVFRGVTESDPRVQAALACARNEG